MSAVAGESRKIRIAVVGAGEFGRNHARVYRQLPGVELVGVYDQDAERAAAVANEFQTRSFRSIEGLCGEAEAASVAVPTLLHAEIGCRLLDMGIDTLIEKPMASTVRASRAACSGASPSSTSIRATWTRYLARSSFERLSILM